MKKSLLLKSLVSVLCLLLYTTAMQAQLVLYEGFDYTMPGYIGGNGAAGTSSNNWTTHSVTTGQTTTIDLATGNLSYSGLQTPTGNMVLLPGANSTVSRDVNRALTSTATTIYYSALISIVDNTQLSSSTPDYFMCVGATTGSAVTILGARLGVKSVNTGSNYRLSILNTSGGTTPPFTEYAQDLNFGTTYLVVVKYDRSTSPTTAYLWVNPVTIGGGEPSGSVTNNAGTGTFATFASICLRNSATTPKVYIDEIRVGESYASVTPGSDVTAPVASFTPLNNAVDVLVNVNPAITFSEPILKTDGSDVTNSDLASLVSFKLTNSSGSDVPFTATISSDKKVITVTPASPLSNSQVYYLAVGAVKDASGNQSTLSNITFTTIAASAAIVTLSYPAGGETVYAGDPITFTWTSTNVANVNIEAYVPDFTRVYNWIPLGSNIPASAGKYDFTIPSDASYGTQYKIRLSDASNSAVNFVSNTFTMIASASNLTDLRSDNIVNDIVRLTGDVTMTFKKVTGNTKYVQDAAAGIMIYDAAGVLTTPLNIGDKFKGLEGKIATYGGVKEIIPTKATVSVTSTGNSVTIPEMTLTDYNTNYAAYESMLIRLSDVTFTDATGILTFAPSTNYNITDGTTTIAFRTFAYIDSVYSDIVKLNKIVPTSHLRMTCIAGFYTSTGTAVQVSSRNLSDFEILTAVEKTSASAPVIYPVPARDVLSVRNVNNISHAEILDASGRVVRSANISSDSEINIPVGDLARGLYFLRLTTPNGKVTSKFIK